jgi:hypothetical protein
MTTQVKVVFEPVASWRVRYVRLSAPVSGSRGKEGEGAVRTLILMSPRTPRIPTVNVVRDTAAEVRLLHWADAMA